MNSIRHNICSMYLYAHTIAMDTSMSALGLGRLPSGESPVRFIPSDLYRFGKIRLRKLPVGHFPLGIITVDT